MSMSIKRNDELLITYRTARTTDKEKPVSYNRPVWFYNSLKVEDINKLIRLRFTGGGNVETFYKQIDSY